MLNEPYGSDIAGGMLYVADRDGGTRADEPSVAVIRRFDLRAGTPAGHDSGVRGGLAGSRAAVNSVPKIDGSILD